MTAATAGMVKSVVVKAAGGGRGTSMSCEAICAAFDPPIEFGSHSEMKGTRKGYQAEHIIPTSTFHKKGRGGPKMPKCDGYSTPQAQTWMVHDAQKPRKEHKILTDRMREFSQNNGKTQKPLSEWLDEYEQGAKDALDKASPKRKMTDSKRDDASMRAAAAKCIRSHAQESFSKMDPPIAMSTPLRNSWTKAAKKAGKNSGKAPKVK